ncbi:MAG: imidazole glycerol phosphate synthase subunit HisH [Calditrichia bacterium]|jgi:glutamine amidotransferase
MKVAVIKYNAGNIQSVRIALERLSLTPKVTNDPDIITRSDKVIFPGVGEASSAMEYLKERDLDQLLLNLKIPVLGICLGLQLMCHHSEENDTDCLGIFDTTVRRFPPEDKVPHMGWNTVCNLQGALFKDIPENSFVYFVHSYFAETIPTTIARTNYILDFACALEKDNYFAVQFHPEKSGPIGEKILKNFLEL